MKHNICRFCPARGCYKVLNNDYFYCDTLENYGQMISETFCVDIRDNASFICDNCILTLRSAREFKLKVTETEHQLKLIGQSEKGNEDNPHVIDIEEYLKQEGDIGDGVILKNEHKILNDTNNIFYVKIETNNASIEYNDKNIEDSTVFDESDTREDVNVIHNKKIKGRKKEAPPTNEDSSTNVQKQLRANTIKLLTNSNICLFKSLKTRFACTDCKEKFFEIQELREHCKMHFNVNAIRIKINRLQGLTYKNADISDLKCSLCGEQLYNIEDLQKHLTLNHGVEFEGSSHLLIPFRLGVGLNCVICDEKFLSFCKLLSHMNGHSTNNVCENCGVSFFNRMSLRTHIRSMHQLHKCSQCTLTFKTTSMRSRHLKKIHDIGSVRRHCHKCGNIFKYTHQLFEHLIVKHGLKRPDYICQDCNKKFNTRNLLGIHIRNVHKKERNFPCSLCEMRFFTKCDMMRHENSHQTARTVHCGYCDGLFKSKEYLRRHMKRFHLNSLQNKS